MARSPPVMVLELISPTPRVHRSYLEAAKEFAAEGRGDGGAGLDTAEGFERHVADAARQAEEDAPRPQGYVPMTVLWYVEGDEYLGRIHIRHRLTQWLENEGGHIGYEVRPSARRRGHATRMLAGALPVARSLGIQRVLVTCDTTNAASRKVIETNGGVLEDERNGKLRFWIDLGGSLLG